MKPRAYKPNFHVISIVKNLFLLFEIQICHKTNTPAGGWVVFYLFQRWTSKKFKLKFSYENYFM